MYILVLAQLLQKTCSDGTWIRIAGYYLLGYDPDSTMAHKTLGVTVGSWSTEKHVLTVDEIPSHSHTGSMYNGYDDGNFTGNDNRPAGADASTSATYTTSKTGGGQGHDHKFYPPAYVVNMWRRTA